jgi:hypothetical protein
MLISVTKKGPRSSDALPCLVFAFGTVVVVSSLDAAERLER